MLQFATISISQRRKYIAKTILRDLTSQLQQCLLRTRLRAHMKTMRRSLVTRVIVVGVILPVLGFISDAGGPLQTWQSLVDWIRGADASNPAPLVFYILSLILFIVCLALLITIIARLVAPSDSKVARDDAGSHKEQIEQKARRVYLDWLSADVDNRRSRRCVR
jgi:hypothetical protein